VPIPNATDAIVAPEKVRDYLLSRTHRGGRFKAAFFGQLGFTREPPLYEQVETRARSLHPASGETW
jgi:hypothetical protein